MDEEWSQMVWIFVQVSIASIVLTAVSLMGSLTKEIGRVKNNEKVAIIAMKEYREYNKYDNTILYPQDIVSLVLETRGRPVVKVDTDPTASVRFDLVWDENSTPQAEFNSVQISNKLPVVQKYKSNIVKDLNGAIVEIEFRRQ